MDTLSGASIFSTISIIVNITHQLDEIIKSIRQASNEFNSLKKELDILTLCLKALAENMESYRQVEISNQRFLTALRIIIESACRLAEDIKRTLESVPGRIPDDRKTWKWSYYDARSDQIKRLMDLTTEIKTLYAVLFLVLFLKSWRLE